MSMLLVPIGHPIEASRAVERVARLASKDDRVVVLHLHEGTGATGTASPGCPEDGACLADIVARTLGQAGIPAAAMVRSSTPTGHATTIATVAMEEQADIVLVGSEPTWLSTHDSPLEQLVRLLPGVRVIGVG